MTSYGERETLLDSLFKKSGVSLAELAEDPGFLQDMMEDVFDELQRSRTELRGEVSALQARNRRLEEYVHMVAHDLKEPLVVMAFTSSLITDVPGLTSEKLNEYVRQMGLTAHEMRRIINNLLHFAEVSEAETLLEPVHMAEDITFLVFLKAWENLDTFQAGQSPFAVWLYHIAHNAVIDHFRTRKIVVPLEAVQPVQLSQSDEVDEKLDLKILSQELLVALKELTGTQREVLILRFICGYTTLEIARSLDKEEGAVRALQMRGLKKLAQYPAIQRERVFE